MRRLLTTTVFGADFPLDIVAVQYKRINLASVSRYWAKGRRGYFHFRDIWSINYKSKLS